MVRRIIGWVLVAGLVGLVTIRTPGQQGDSPADRAITADWPDGNGRVKSQHPRARKKWHPCGTGLRQAILRLSGVVVAKRRPCQRDFPMDATPPRRQRVISDVLLPDSWGELPCIPSSLLRT